MNVIPPSSYEGRKEGGKRKEGGREGRKTNGGEER
jgi:hypothetical protein